MMKQVKKSHCSPFVLIIAANITKRIVQGTQSKFIKLTAQLKSSILSWKTARLCWNPMFEDIFLIRKPSTTLCAV